MSDSIPCVLSPLHKMSTPVQLCARPVRTVMFHPNCAYCGKSANHFSFCLYQLAVLACDDIEHKRCAERDAKAWLGRNGYVRPKEYKDDPLFLAVTDCVVVRRSSGIIEQEGWKVAKASYSDPAVASHIEGKWYLPVVNDHQDLRKYIIVQELKLSLPEHDHHLVDAFEARLIAGFYTTEMQIYEMLEQDQASIENPTNTSLAPPIEENIVPSFHEEYGYGRVFIPTVAAVCERNDSLPSSPL